MATPPLRGIARVLVAVTRLSLDHPLAVLLVAIALTAASLAATFQLRLDTDLKALLPHDTPSVLRLEDLAARLGGQSDLMVEIRSPDPAANVRFGAAVTAWLERRDDVRFTIFRRDKGVLERSVLLFLPLEQVEELRDRVKERIRREVRKQLSVGGGGPDPGEDDDEADEADEADPFEAVGAGARAAPSTLRDTDLALDTKKLRARFEGYDVPEYLTADEGRLLVVKARPGFATTDVARTRALVADVRAAIAALEPASFHAGMEVGLEGLYADLTDQVDTMRDDVLGSTAICFAILLVLIVLYFRRVRPLLYIFVPLVLSTAWSLGVAWLFFGVLNLVSAFIFAILLGLGIDFGIHVIARYREEIASGSAWRAAYLDVAGSTGASVFTGATTTAAVFFLLAIARFKGFSQLGVVAGFGVLFSLTAVFTLTPAILALLEPRLPWTPRHHAGTRPRRATVRVGYVWAPVLAILLAGGGYAGYSVRHFRDLQFETDFGRLGSVKRVDPDAPRVTRPTFRDAVGRVTTGAPAVVMADDPGDAERLYRDLALISEADADTQYQLGRATSLAEIPDGPLRALADRYGLERMNTLGRLLSKTFSLYTFVPTDQDAKLRVLADLRRRLEAKRGLFEGQARIDADDLLAHTATDALTVATLPEWIRAQFRALDGREGTFVLLWTRGSKDDYATASRLKRALFDLPVGHDTVLPSAANYYVLADVVDTVQADAPKVLIAAFLAILFFVSVQLRRPIDVLLVLLPLAMSLAWVGGYLVQTDTKLTFYSMVVLPLLLGLGVDASVHLVARYRQEGPGSLPAILRQTGGALLLCALTTAVGFGGVFYADHQGLNGLGTLGIVGIGLTFTSSLLVVPSLLWLGERWRARWHPSCSHVKGA